MSETLFFGAKIYDLICTPKCSRKSDYSCSGAIVTTSNAAIIPVLEESHEKVFRQAEMCKINGPLPKDSALIEEQIMLGFSSAAVEVPWILVSGGRRSSTRREAGTGTRSEC